MTLEAQVVDLEFRLREVVRERDEARWTAIRHRNERDEARAALAGAENSLTAEREHSARLSRECQERHDELRAEVERLRFLEDCRGDGLTYECNLTRPCVTCRLRTVAERQREACARQAGTWSTAAGDAVRVTPLVTEGEP